MNIESLRPLLLGILFLSILLWFGYKNSEKVLAPDEEIHIAFVGPLTGSDADEGLALKQGVELYVKQLNEREEGGVNGKHIVLDVYDDQNNSKLAEKAAREIVEAGKAVAVVGHYYSSCSIAAGKIYKQHGIPAITPGSTNVKVTDENEWYFRTIFNDDLQGRYIANYLRKVLKQNVVSVIHHDNTYGKDLARVLEKTLVDLGGSVPYTYEFTMGAPDLNERLDAIVNELKTKTEQEVGFIFLATFAGNGAKLVSRLKDANLKFPIIVPAAFDSKTFLNTFRDMPEEKKNPGYYTDGIYITTPLIYDTANEKAQEFKETYKTEFGEEANLRVPFAYDAAMVIMAAIEQTNASGRPDTLRDDRRKIRSFLENMDNSGQAIEGTTGFNYFDEFGDAQKPVAVGTYKNNRIVSALVQLQDVRNPNEIVDLEKAVREGHILTIDNKYLYKTNVVYVGVKINEIHDLNLKSREAKLDFYVWLRYRGEDIHPEELDFVNAVNSIHLLSLADMDEDDVKLPVFSNEKENDQQMTYRFYRPINIEKIGDMQHRLYRIKEPFKIDFLQRPYALREHVLGVSFRHRDLTRNNLIYVTDYVGMGDEEESLNKLRQSKVFSTSLDWSLNRLWFFQKTIKENALGSLQYLNIVGGAIEFSQFNMGVQIVNNTFTLRRSISRGTADNVLLLSSIVILLLGFRRTAFKYFSKTIWIFQALFSFLLLMSSEVVLLSWVVEENIFRDLTMLIKIYDILWWIIPAILLHLAVERFLWTPVEERTGRAIPRIGRRFVSFSIYMLTALAIVAFVYDQKLTSLLATSGVIAMIIGLAIQINISNIFSGMAINIEHPFRVGDWVQIGTFEEGKVVDITWRTTRIITRMGCILSIPNSMAAESTIHNYDYPDDTFWLRFIVHVHPSHHPERVRKIIRDAVLSTEVVLKTPEPFIIFRGLSDWAADYLVYFVVRDYAWRLLHEEAVWLRIWIHLNRAGIAPAIQRQEIHLFKGVKERGEEAATKPITLLQEVTLFRPFSDKAKNYLSDCMHKHRFSEGDIIVRQGDAGNSLFIIVEGVVGVRVQSPEGESIEVARLGAGEFFGEMALLTGEDRAATIIALTGTYLFEITKEDIKPLLENEPDVRALVTKVLTQRQMMTQSQMHTEHNDNVEEEAAYKKLLDRIENFFGLRGKS
ncbi:MAG: ABC transporter substrate-binding protein [Thiotrichaceae bacterium]|nr:ABC transporter substrate-binding protein [Thiotrichaceae bacterium]